ncbi:MAG: antibiotic biosynthesis monooxygenase [Curvibacter lanceolatus]|jgi:heme-degrading monooxygenase HmoA|uniref:antibiotic biosynthesis monooxygenase family protein n=1 Tax=Curvibacter lanceolatus TaxID=86182 RepID=UPI000372A4B9|nr:antibiotic biosynthesis monooxygenase [Curvibacter lanceolatus]MBV5292149.1 antibiotic biosynthesis monooxygenase [Curvibacter lanceolatus]
MSFFKSIWTLAPFGALAFVLLGGLSACSGLALSKPFAWPGLATAQARLTGAGRDTVVLAITHAQLIGAERAAFDRGADQVVEMLPAQPGIVGYSVRSRVLGHEVWTATVWRDDASIDAFVRSPEHLTAVRQGSSAIAKVEYHRVQVRVSDLPLDWSRVLAELERAAARAAATPR